MSDVDEPRADSRIEKVKKPRAPMTQSQKDTLARGRAKLAAQRQAAKARILEIEDDPVGAVEKKEAPPAPKKSTKKPQRVIVEDESDESEPEIHVIRRRSKPKPAPRVVYASDDEEEEEDEPEPEPTPRPSRTRSAPVPRRPARAAAPRTQPQTVEEPFHVSFF